MSKKSDDREITHEQAEILVAIEARLAIRPGSEAWTAEKDDQWTSEMSALGTRYIEAGGTLDELQFRFNGATSPAMGRFTFRENK